MRYSEACDLLTDRTVMSNESEQWAAWLALASNELFSGLVCLWDPVRPAPPGWTDLGPPYLGGLHRIMRTTP